MNARQLSKALRDLKTIETVILSEIPDFSRGIATFSLLLKGEDYARIQIPWKKEDGELKLSNTIQFGGVEVELGETFLEVATHMVREKAFGNQKFVALKPIAFRSHYHGAKFVIIRENEEPDSIGYYADCRLHFGKFLVVSDLDIEGDQEWFDGLTNMSMGTYRVSDPSRKVTPGSLIQVDNA